MEDSIFIWVMSCCIVWLIAYIKFGEELGYIGAIIFFIIIMIMELTGIHYIHKQKKEKATQRK